MRVLVKLLFCFLATVSCDYLPEPIKEDPEGESIKTAETNKTQEQPLMYLIQPYERNGIEGADSSIYPCGGLPRGKTHLLITPGSYSIVQWRTIKSAPEGKCVIRISHGIANESTFATLYPRDKSSNSAGYFDCGRYTGMYETKEFAFPANLSCDTCTLQLTWETPEFKKYYCTDITIMSDEVKHCMGSCLNGGSCVNGNCVCEEPYYGKSCENKEKLSIPVGKMWIFYILLTALIGVLGFAIYKTWPKASAPLPNIIKEHEKVVGTGLSNQFADNQPIRDAHRDRHGDYQNLESKWLSENVVQEAQHEPSEEELKEGSEREKPPFEEPPEQLPDPQNQGTSVKPEAKYVQEGNIEEPRSQEPEEKSEHNEDENVSDVEKNLGDALIDSFK